MKAILVLTLALFTAVSATTSARAVECDPNLTPYYHRIETGPGSLIADLFLLRFASSILVLTAPVAAYDSSHVKKAWCMNKQLTTHALNRVKVSPFKKHK